MSSEMELAVYEYGVRRVIGTATVSDDGHTVSAEITDEVWADIICRPELDSFSISTNRRRPREKGK